MYDKRFSYTFMPPQVQHLDQLSFQSLSSKLLTLPSQWFTSFSILPPSCFLFSQLFTVQILPIQCTLFTHYYLNLSMFPLLPSQRYIFSVLPHSTTIWLGLIFSVPKRHQPSHSFMLPYVLLSSCVNIFIPFENHRHSSFSCPLLKQNLHSVSRHSLR